MTQTMMCSGQASQAERDDMLLRVAVEAMDEGFIITDADDRVRMSSRNVAAMIGVAGDALADGTPFADVRAQQVARGEFAHLFPRLRDRLESGEPRMQIYEYERERPNGVVLQTRSLPLETGGRVRVYADVTARREAQRALQVSEHRYRLIAENTNDIIILYDTDAIRRYVSPAASKILGYAPEDLVGTSGLDFIHPDDLTLHAEVFQQLLSGEVRQALLTWRHRHRDGGWVWLEASYNRPHYDPNAGETDGYVVVLRDVTARREAEEALRASEADLRVSQERLALALDSGEDCLFDWDLTTGALWVTERWRDKLGLVGDLAQPSTSAWSAAIHPYDRKSVAAATHAHLKGLTPALECEYRVRRADGSAFWVLARARVASRTPDGRALRLVGTLIDISQRKETEALIAHMAEHDALTDLPNRHLLRRHLDAALNAAVNGSSRHALLVCDLDHFKVVNDSFGHLAGDRLLCAAAERIRSVLRPQDIIARLGGDEFAVVVTELDQDGTVNRICEHVIAALDEPIRLDDAVVSIGVSIGAALIAAQGDSAVEVFKRADTALYAAKAAGRNTYRLCDAESHARMTTRSALALDMREAIRRGDFFLVYQPITDLTTGTVVAFEALMRWRHPVRGLISPADFIPVAEENGLIVPLGAWALAEACREAAGWPTAVRVTVNVSTVQFRGGLEQAVVAALGNAGLSAHRLVLEVTESALMDDPEEAILTLHRLRTLGTLIALDDFGTGYSSLSYLRSFPFDKIKIDRAFIKDIADPDAAAIVRAVVGIGERLGMSIIAEGVETAEQLALVHREGCTEVQGFLFSRPLPVEEARTYMLLSQPQDAA